MNYLYNKENLPCNETLFPLMIREYKMVTPAMIEELTDKCMEGSRIIDIPILSSRAFNKYKLMNLASLVNTKVPSGLKNKYFKTVNKLYKADQKDYGTLITDKKKLTDVLFLGINELEKRKSDLEKFYIDYVQGDHNEYKAYDYLIRTDKADKDLNTLNSVVRNIEKNESDILEVFILSSGSWGWERLEAGQFNLDYHQFNSENINFYQENQWVIRDYETSHKEGSVINNFLNHPAAFYLFIDYNGIERGYTRGHVDFDNNSLFIKCEAIHATPHISVKRDPKITNTSEVALIGGLIHLSNLLDIQEIRWGNVGVARKYGLQVWKKENGNRKSYFEWKIPGFFKTK
jgi:hypothetical protein